MKKNNERLEKLTTTYVPEEDRIMVSGQLSDGRTLALWLTQRLLKMLIPNITERLQKMEDSLDSVNTPNVKDKHLEDKNTKSVPVSLSEKSVEEWLVTSVDISNNDSTIMLVFKRSSLDKVSFIADKSLMNQWLDILKKNFESASWPLDVWLENVYSKSSKIN
ncbi:hypothetical protein [Flexistipes sinusarabici]|uniref:Uncharacterized protein n=1 Tax=Flexistipes sinusarabici TaxID=2352 RepID=A0A3D5QAC8_FLESI|nr:hypothetical protein [Flexistipes sinusarabici]HCW92787.1 hypothetical protein [Flexistipes sinusarabici]